MLDYRIDHKKNNNVKKVGFFILKKIKKHIESIAFHPMFKVFEYHHIA